MSKDNFFIGWSDKTPEADRRFLLCASLALVAGGGTLGASLALGRTSSGGGVWDQGTRRTLRGALSREPYPALQTRDLDGTLHTVFLATAGKGAPRIDAGYFGNVANVTGTLITRGQNAMMAVTDVRASADSGDAVAFSSPAAVDHGPVRLVGEILDAKCWFGAMRPAYGKTHKACAALCARGRLPLAFCQIGACGDDEKAPLLLNEHGRAFDRSILPLVADPVIVEGRLIAVGDVLQLRAKLDAIHRL